MKNPFALFAGSVLLGAALCACTLGLPGCATQIDPAGVYGPSGEFGTNNNFFILSVDKTLGDSKQTLNAFVTWELQNRPSLPASVTKVADTIRDEAPLWFTNAYIARSNYVFLWRSNPGAASAASNVLQASVSQISAQAAASSAITNSTH